ncbi:hypothetical protein G6F68_013020 [Rhizopus microsporus]|nr:hypothetical protein G6F68_013020 [Rhizopus microsporus]
MATPRQKRARRSTNKNTRRVADRHRKRVTITGNAIIKANWDKKLTLRQNYAKLGLLTSLNGQTGGSEKKMSEESVAEQEPIDLKELTEEEIEKLKKTLGPGEGIIQRDDEGNVVRVIVGEAKSHDEILDAEVEPVEAKTDVVRQLEEQAANAFHREKYQSGFETHWIQKIECEPTYCSTIKKEV